MYLYCTHFRHKYPNFPFELGINIIRKEFKKFAKAYKNGFHVLNGVCWRTYSLVINKLRLTLDIYYKHKNKKF